MRKVEPHLFRNTILYFRCIGIDVSTPARHHNYILRITPSTTVRTEGVLKVKRPGGNARGVLVVYEERIYAVRAHPLGAVVRSVSRVAVASQALWFGA